MTGTTFQDLKKMTAGKTFPMTAVNADGEAVIVEAGKEGGVRFYKLSTAQHNNWLRINYIWEDGTMEELYER